MSNLSYVAYTGDGVTNQFLLAVDGGEIGYLRTDDIHVYVNDVEVTFNIETASPHLVILDAAPASGSEVVLRREMPQGTTYSDFSRGNKFGPKNMNNSFQQGLYLTQEILDGYLPEGSTQKQDLNFGGKHAPTNLRAPVVPSDATNKEYVDARDTEQRDRLTSLETAHIVSSANDMLSYTYNGGSALGGELTFSVGIPFVSVNRLYINGVHQTYGLAWDYDNSLQIVELAEELDTGDEVVVELGVDAQKILDNEVVSSNATVVSDVTNQPIRLGTIAMNSVPIKTIADLRTYNPVADGQVVDVLGHTLAGVGGGQFYYDPDDTTSADNNGTVIVTSSGERWKRKIGSQVLATEFGCVSGGIEDNAINLQRIEDFISLSNTVDTVVYDGTFATSTINPRSGVKRTGGVIVGLNSRLFKADSNFVRSSWKEVLFVTEVPDAAIVLVDTPYVTQDITFNDNISVGYATAVSARATSNLRAIITRNRIFDSVASSNIFWSIYLQSDLTSTQISIIDGNIIDNTSAGVLAADKAVISNNIIDIQSYTGNGSHGIYLSAVDGTVVNGNYVKTKKECIPCNQANNCSITGNYMETTGINAIRLQESKGSMYSNNVVVLDAVGGTAASFVRGFATGVSASTECSINKNKFRVINGNLVSNPFVFASDGSTSAWDVSVEDNEFYDVDTSALTGTFFQQAFAKVFDSVQADEIIFKRNTFKNITDITTDFRGRQILFRGCYEFKSKFEFTSGLNVDTNGGNGSLWFDTGSAGAINASQKDGEISTITKEAGVGVYKIVFSNLVALESFEWSGTGSNTPLEIRPALNNLAGLKPYYNEVEFTLYDGARAAFNPNFNCTILIKTTGTINNFSDLQYKYGLS